MGGFRTVFSTCLDSISLSAKTPKDEEQAQGEEKNQPQGDEDEHWNHSESGMRGSQSHLGSCQGRNHVSKYMEFASVQ